MMTDEQKRLVEAGAANDLVKGRINIAIEERLDGGVRVWSEELPGLILSGPDQVLVIRDIGEAVVTLLRYKRARAAMT